MQRRLGATWRLGLAAILAMGGAIAGFGAWLWLDDRPGWSDSEVLTAVGIAAAAGAAATGGLSGTLLTEWSAYRRSGDERVGAGLTDEDLDAWQQKLRQAILAKRVRGGDSQLSQMVRVGPIFDMSLEEGDITQRAIQSRLQILIRNRKVPLSAVKAEWDSNLQRLVILGPAGYGKTVLSLSLVAHMNLKTEKHSAIAEIFSLNEWYHLYSQNAALDIEGWLVTNIATNYGNLGVTRAVARALISTDRIIPILDGLDEVPDVDDARRKCKRELDEFSGQVEPHRRFIITCREEEYLQLAPDWVSADKHVRLLGLTPDRVVDILEERTVDNQPWRSVRTRLKEGDTVLSRLFASPLRLSIALEAFRLDDSVQVLLGASRSEAEGVLWDHLLDRGSDTFGHAKRQQLKAWLAALATAMSRDSNFRFRLVEVEDYYDQVLRSRSLDRQSRASNGDLRVPKSRVAFSDIDLRGSVYLVVLGVLVSTTTAFVAVHLSTSGRNAMIGSAYLAFAVSFLALFRDHFSRRTRAVAQHLGGIDRSRLYLGSLLLIGMVVLSLVLSNSTHDIRVIVLAVTAMAVALRVVAPTRWFSGGPSSARRGGPMGPLLAARNRGVLVLAAISVPTSLACGALVFMFASNVWAFGAGAVVGCTLGTILALEAGLDTWLHFHWFRYHAWLVGVLPRRLPQFLAWCAHPGRGWLRAVSDSYEFRHRELLDHLAAAERRVGALGPD